MVKKIIAYLFVCFFLIHPLRAGDDFCGIRNVAFVSGEEINYNLYYSVIGLYLNAGSAKFTVAQEKINETPSYHARSIELSTYLYHVSSRNDRNQAKRVCHTYNNNR